jgi:uncharacterized protein YegP (UPF0339 family)
MRHTFEIFPGKNGRFYWRLRAANGEIVCDSAQGNGYSRRDSARRSTKRLLRHLQTRLVRFKNVKK